tara:strand:- start:17 stop:511 length:495 start_codon:yes stop_codon:yes gene_type:complete
MTILQNYLKSKRVQKILNTKPGEEGFSLIELVVVIAVLAILSAVAIPAFSNVQANARASAVQNGLVNGIKECFVLEAENKDTNFSDTATFSSVNAFRGFTLEEFDDATFGGDTCFAATADADSNSNDSDFSIYINGAGVAVKTCSHGDQAQCTPNEGNDGPGTW